MLLEKYPIPFYFHYIMRQQEKHVKPETKDIGNKYVKVHLHQYFAPNYSGTAP